MDSTFTSTMVTIIKTHGKKIIRTMNTNTEKKNNPAVSGAQVTWTM